MKKILFLFLALAVLPSVARAQVINYPSGFASSSGQIWLENFAALSGSQIHLVPSSVHNGSNAWFETPENIQAFTTTFTFHIDCSAQPSNCGNGLAFEIICACTGGNFTYDPGSGKPGYTYSGFSGAQFSLSSCEVPLTPANGTTSTSGYCYNNGLNGNGGAGQTAGLPAAVMVKFDNYNNVSGTAGASFTGYYANGINPDLPTNPQYDMSGSINLDSGDLFSATLTYDGWLLTETLTDTVTSASYTIKYGGISIPTAITANTGFVGFGGGTGAAIEDAYLNTWTYTVNSSGAATPTFSPAAGSYSSTQSVTLSSTTSGATICYSTTVKPKTNGAGGCTAGTLYSSAISVSASETLFAVAGTSGLADSVPVGSATYNINSQTAAPVGSLPSGTYSFPQTLIVESNSVEPAILYCTGVGCTPSSVYKTAVSTSVSGITISSAETVGLNATSTTPGSTASPTVYYTYSSSGAASTPTFSPSGGTYTGSQSVTLSTSSSGAVICYTANGTTPATNGTTGCTNGTLYAGAITVSSNETLRAIAGGTGYSDSSVAAAAYIIGANTKIIGNTTLIGKTTIQ